MLLHPIIETERLILRPPHGDEVFLNQAIKESLPELSRWMPWARDPSIETTRNFIHKNLQHWGTDEMKEMAFITVLKQENLIIGACGYNDESDPFVPYFEIGYWIHSHFTGKGLATELALALSHYAFDVFKAVRVQICCQPDNVKSRRVIEKCGYQFEAKLRNQCLDLLSGKPTDRLVFACFSPEQLPKIFIKYTHTD
ncbi:N-acetyltransferase [Legionella jordanis]|uniref:GNAT family N-acetyltransferase n=1 Tax=Legionella jordanis TaxID=456 RepID=UPI000EFEFFC1|nr:GNAT family N-acetyltransferase [Legionella jordanis]RMX15794.1 N-acetyltransferase [Legionella jordanis]